MSARAQRSPMRMTARDARRVAIAAQRLVCGPSATRRGILDVVRTIGYLQLDPTNVVARNPQLVLWSRLGRYDPALLDRLMRDRDLFETVSLIVPTSDLALHLATMRAYRLATEGRAPTTRGRLEGAGGGTWPKRAGEFLARNPRSRRAVLAQLRRSGPLLLSQFAEHNASSWTVGRWDDEGNTSLLLAILHRRGEVVVAARSRGQKVFDLMSRALPKARPLAGLALEREATRRAIASLGTATLKQLTWHYAFGRHVTKRALDTLERDGEIARVEITDAAWKGPRYALSGALSGLECDERTTLLSPFDNLIIDRDRTEELFGFRYRIEIYTPPKRRIRGYWAMPVLHGDRIVGSVDPSLDRERDELVVNRLVLERGAPRDATPAIRRAVDDLAAFAGAKRVRWARSPRRGAL